MKIAWFTPFQKESAIGRYSKYATDALAGAAEIDIFTDGCGELHPTALKVARFADHYELYDTLKPYDFVVYNLGNNLEYHKGVYEVLRRVPGIVIAHDASMLHFVRAYYNEEKNNKAFHTVLHQLYGGEARHLTGNMDNPLLQQRVDFLKFNMMELVLRNAQGVIVHSDYHAALLKNAYSGPIAVLPLIKMRDYENEALERDNGFGGYGQGRVNVLSVGYVNWNKLADKVMDAVAGSKVLRKSVFYAVVGGTQDQYYLASLLEKMRTEKLGQCVAVTGRVDDTTLHQYYANADIVCNLRRPAIEGDSATLQEQMYQGKTVVAVDTGAYRNVPDDCVVKVDPNNLENSLREKLERLVADEAYRKGFGARAKQYAEAHYAPQEYVKRFLEFTGETGPVVFLRPLYDLLYKIRFEAHAMGLNTEEGDCSLQTVSNLGVELEKMFAYPEKAEEA